MPKISIKSKLIRMQLILASAVLLACLICFAINDLFIFKRSIERNLQSVAKILSENLMPTLAFSDKNEATKILSSLQSEPSISSSVLLDSNGNLFAQYGKHYDQSDLEFFKNIHDSARISLKGSHVILLHPILQNNELKGSLYFDSDLKVFAVEYKSYIWVLCSVFAAGLLMSFGLAHLIQRSLSQPFIALAETAKNISSTGNYYFRMSPQIIEDSISEISILLIQFNLMLDQIETRDEEIRAANVELENKVELRTQELRETQKSALQNAHAAGMAEIATGILHNIGNILNSVNTSVDEVHEVIQSSKLQSLLKANEMLEANKHRLSEFLISDPKGKLLPEYYQKLGVAMKAEHEKLDLEAKALMKKVGLIKDVIQTQQEYAKKDLFFEEISLAQITDEILNLQLNSLNRHGIEVVKSYHQIRAVRLQRAKFAHILMNLVKNAKEAMARQEAGNKILKIEINSHPTNGAFLRITDTGEGIEIENLEKIFNHGFTTKKSGHGFGLHFCANAMTEMNGKLVVESQGSGKGATFTLYFSEATKDRKYA